MGPFKIKLWGPRRLREIFSAIETAINERTIIDGIGYKVSGHPYGSRIKVGDNIITATGGDGGGGVGGESSGVSADIAGALNGAPAIYHLKQSSAPTALPLV